MFLVRSRITEPVALALAMSVASPAAAQAVVQSEVVVRYVSTSDLDLASPADVRRLRRRVEAAVTKICGVSSQVDLFGGILIDKCRRMAARSAEPQIAALIQRDTEYAAARVARPVG